MIFIFVDNWTLNLSPESLFFVSTAPWTPYMARLMLGEGCCLFGGCPPGEQEWLWQDSMSLIEACVVGAQ